MGEAQRNRFDQLEHLCKEILENTGHSWMYTSTVEDVELEVEQADENDYTVILTLEGDFVKEMLNYLAINGDDTENPMYNKFRVILDRFSFSKLTDQVAEINHG